MCVFTALKIGLQAARANVRAAFVLWLLASLIALLHFSVPAFAIALEPVAGFMSDNPHAGSLVSQGVFGGVLVWLLYSTDRRICPKRKTLTAVLQMTWGCVFGLACVWFFHLQERVFGPNASILILTKKVFVDQFVWTLLLSPLSAAFNYWLGKDMSLSRCRKEWPASGLLGIVLPNLIMNWCIWIPANYCVYSFPPAMRIVVCGLLGTLWTLVSRQIGARSGRVGGSYEE